MFIELKVTILSRLDCYSSSVVERAGRSLAGTNGLVSFYTPLACELRLFSFCLPSSVFFFACNILLFHFSISLNSNWYLLELKYSVLDVYQVV